MNHERAEIYLRLLAEAELRQATTLPADGTPDSGTPDSGTPDSGLDRGHSARLAWVGQTLAAVHAVSADTVSEIRASLELALTLRSPGQLKAASQNAGARRRAMMRRVGGPGGGSSVRTGPGGSHPDGPRTPWRLVPVGHVIELHADDSRGELCLLAYVQTEEGAYLTVSSWMDGWTDGLRAIFGPLPGPPSPTQSPVSPHTPLPFFAATDDRGTSYSAGFSGGRTMLNWQGVFELRPDPARDIRWLDVRGGPSEAVTRIELIPYNPPEVTVAPTDTGAGEHVLTSIAARLLALAPLANDRRAASKPGSLDSAVDGLGKVVTALRAAEVLPTSSPLPGQLAALCAALGIGNHGITAPPAGELPECWRNVLEYYHRERRRTTPGGWVALAAELPELDGARIALLGLHLDEDGTTVHLLANGATMEDDGPPLLRGVRPMPVIWLRDSRGGWHTTRLGGLRSKGASADVMVRLMVVPPLDRTAAWVEVVAVGQSAQARVTLPLRWI